MPNRLVDSPLPSLHRRAPADFSGTKGLNVVTGATTREGYLAELRHLAEEDNWVSFHCNELVCYLVLGEHSSGHPKAGKVGLQVQNEMDVALLRRKCIATMRAWVVRNIQNEASRAKEASMKLTKAEQRALVLFHPQFNPDRRLVRYRGGAWAMPGLKTEGPGELPVIGGRVGKTGVSVLRKMALKGYVVLDEVKGEATLA